MQRLRQYFDVIEVAEAAMKRQPVVAPCLEHDLYVFAKDRIAVVSRDTEVAVLGGVEAASGAEVDATAGEYVEQCDLLGEPQRVIKRRE